jgi:hypothetical protein
VNRTLDNGSDAFVYTPQEDWSFIRDDGSLEGNSTLLEEYKEGQNGNGGSLSVTDKTASVDIPFTGKLSFLSSTWGQANARLDDLCVWCLWTPVRPSAGQAG